MVFVCTFSRNCQSVFSHKCTILHFLQRYRSDPCFWFCCYLNCLFQREEEMHPASTDSLPPYPEQPGLEQCEARSPELHPGLPHGRYGPASGVVFCCLGRCVGRKLCLIGTLTPCFGMPGSSLPAAVPQCQFPLSVKLSFDLLSSDSDVKHLFTGLFSLCVFLVKPPFRSLVHVLIGFSFPTGVLRILYFRC